MAEGGGTTQVEQVEEIELMSLEEERIGHDLEELSGDHEGSPLHKAINDNELSKVRDIIVGESVNTIRLMFLLDERDKKNRTALHSAVHSQNLAMVVTLLGYVPTEQRKELLRAKDHYGATPLHLATQNKRKKQLLAILLKDLNEDDCFDAIRQTNKSGENVLHLVAAHCRLDLIRQVLDLLPRVRLRAELLIALDSRQRTALHGCGRDDSCLRYLLDSVDITTRLQIIQLWKGNKRMLLDVLEMTPNGM